MSGVGLVERANGVVFGGVSVLSIKAKIVYRLKCCAEYSLIHSLVGCEGDLEAIDLVEHVIGLFVHFLAPSLREDRFVYYSKPDGNCYLWN